jgi:hypothetical protein
MDPSKFADCKKEGAEVANGNGGLAGGREGALTLRFGAVVEW